MEEEEIEEEVPIAESATGAHAGASCQAAEPSKEPAERLSSSSAQGAEHEYEADSGVSDKHAAETAQPAAHDYSTSREGAAPCNVQQQEKLTKIYQQALRQGRLSPEPHPASNTAYHSTRNPVTSSDKQHEARNHASMPAESAGRPCNSPSRPSTADRLTNSRPLSAQLKTFSSAAAQLAVQNGAAQPAGAAPLVDAAGHQHHSRSPGRLSSPKPRRYTPGPGAYTPEIDRQGKCISPTHARGSFPIAERYEGSYIEAFAKTLHSPGPIYYPGGGSCVIPAIASSPPSGSGDTAGSTVGTSHSRSILTRTCSLDSRRTTNVTARATHSMNGSWSKADIGSREQLIVHRCHSPGSRSGAKCSSCGSGCAKLSSCSGSGASVRCPGCGAAAGSSVPGPGSYDVSVAADGRGVLLTQSCPAFSVPKAGRLTAGRHSQFVSAKHAHHENQCLDSPGPVYNPDISPTRPGSCSPTMSSRGLNHWDALYKSMSATPAKQILGPSPVSRGGKRLLGDGPRTHFGSGSLELQHWPLISGRHSRILYTGRHGAENRYKPSYAQVDVYMGTRVLASGPEDRFEDTSYLSYITHATGQTRIT